MKRKVYYRFLKAEFISNFCKTFIPFMILMCTTIYLFDKVSDENIEIRNQNVMNQIKEQFDGYFREIDSMVKFFNTDNYIENTLQELFEGNQYLDTTEDKKRIIFTLLKGMVAANDKIDSCILTSNNSNNRYLIAANNQVYIKWKEDINRFDYYLNKQEEHGCEVRSNETAIGSCTPNLFTVWKCIYSKYVYNENKFIIILNYSMDRLTDLLDNMILYPGQVIYVMKPDNTLIIEYGNNSTEKLFNIICDTLGNKSKYGDKSECRCDNDKYKIFRNSSGVSDYQFVSAIPSRELSKQKIIKTVILIIAANAAFGLSYVTSVFSAKRRYKKLYEIIDIFNNAEMGNVDIKERHTNKRNPYDDILNNIIQMYLKQFAMNSTIRDNEYQLEIMKLHMLQNQINPHFLYNTLNTIYWEAIKFTKSQNSCSNMIEDLSEIMRYSLSNVSEKVSLKEEVMYLKHYIAICEARCGDNLSVNWNIEEQAQECCFMKMLVQPIVENCLSHGIKNMDDGCIWISMVCVDDRVLIMVRDNGIGMTEDKLAELRNKVNQKQTLTEHIGLVNTNHRLVIAYGDESKLEIKSVYKKGTTVSFSVPFKHIEEE